MNNSSLPKNNSSLTPKRMPAEWENDGAIMISWPHSATDWVDMLEDVTKCYVELSRAILDSGQFLLVISPDPNLPRKELSTLPQDRIIYATVPTNDTWTRDYGPITVENAAGESVIVDFKFNGWGLKFASDRDNLVTGRLVSSGCFSGLYRNELSFVLEGGSIESDGNGTILTTSQCLMSPNRNGGMSREEIIDKLRDSICARHILWVDHGALAGDDTDSHIDTLVRIAPGDTLIYTGCIDPSDEHYTELKTMAEQLATLRTADGNPFNLVWLPLPDAIYDEDGLRLPATYANYLVTPSAVLMPTYDQPMNDRLASMILRSVFEREVITVDCRALIRQHGSLHCATMQLPRSILPV